MKIYTAVTVDMRTFATLDEESFEYSGPVVLCKGGSNEVKETSQEQTLAKISMEQWNEYQTRFRPFEDEWISNLRMDQGDTKNFTGQTAAGVGAEFDKIQGSAQKEVFNAGIDPSSGRYKAEMAGLGDRRGTATGKAVSLTGQAVDDQTYQGLQQAVAMGRGQSAEALRDMTSLAYDATGKAISDERQKQDTNQTWVSTGMSAAGMGLAGWQARKPTSSLLPVDKLKANGES